MSQTLAHNVGAKERTRDVIITENYNFDALFLSNETSQGLRASGFLKPSPIQLKAIPLGRCGLDLIVKAKSGTGKTAVFTVIALEMLSLSKNALQVLVFAPTREIAVQIEDVVKTIGKEFTTLQVASFIGGLPMKDDMEKAKSCHVAIGAPGRLKHLVEQGYFDLSAVRLLVFDEADKLMDHCFQNDINYIYHKLPKRKQVIALSATYTEDLKTYLERYMMSPAFVCPEDDTAVLLGLKQFVTVVEASPNVVKQLKTKTDELIQLLSKIPFTQCLVFSNYQQRTESLSNTLNTKGWSSMYISAAQTQKERLKSYNSLKKFQCRILLSTDLTARGIDASNVDLVINYDVPREAATYMHRMGRAGRYGSRGIYVSICADGGELQTLQNILGEIGGHGFSIAKLPAANELIHVWECNTNHCEKIFAIVDGSSKKSDLKNSILDLKNEIKNQTDSVSKGLKRLSMHGNEKTLGSKQMEQVTKKLAEMDTETLLSGLASGQSLEVAPKTKEQENWSEVLKSLANGESLKDQKTFEEVADESLVPTGIHAVGHKPCAEVDTESLLRGLATGKDLKVSSLMNEEVDVESLLTTNASSVVEKQHTQVDTESLLKGLASGETIEVASLLKDRKTFAEVDAESLGFEKRHAEVDTECLLKALAGGGKLEVSSVLKERETVAEVDAESLVTKDTSPIVKKKSKHQQDETIEDPTQTTSTEELISPASLYPWITVKESVLSKPFGKSLLESETPSSKRKLKPKPDPEDIEKLKPHFTAIKNIALFNISKLISNADFEEDVSYATGALQNYLALEEQPQQDLSEKPFEDCDAEDLLQNIAKHSEQWRLAHKCNQPSELLDPEENIFKLAYHTQVEENALDWAVALGDRYVEEDSEEESVQKKEEGMETQEEEDAQDMEAEYEEEEEYDYYSEEAINLPTTSKSFRKKPHSYYSRKEKYANVEDAYEKIQNTKLGYHDQKKDYNKRRTNWSTRNRRHYETRRSYYPNQRKNKEVENKVRPIRDGHCNQHSSSNDLGYFAEMNSSEAVTTSGAPDEVANVSHDSYNPYFDYYGQVLQRDALAFEDEASFNNWYGQWRAQLQSTTNFVWQNLYLQEMNDYTYNRSHPRADSGAVRKNYSFR